ncbi:hypothetical protein GWM83_03930, partial [Candidatus Bathyarchaeota archaeon]|nr:hypothetical protein [Candidatus Bathyarchaeota archaeon]NIV67944.1 hypothetical protein [Candidatus Bathyarchaeota archaeon]NIW34690.1 hypothetical protein [Candidatus Bathyarchaeota archaeon]
DLERQLRKDGPYRVMGTFIGVLVPWKKFYKEVSRDLDNVSDTRLQGLGPSTATELFPIVGDQIYEGDQA